jgi:hypothetical protein
VWLKPISVHAAAQRTAENAARTRTTRKPLLTIRVGSVGGASTTARTSERQIEMTDKQQPPAVPERIDADTILQSIVETPAGERIRMTCGAADLRSVITDILEYARVHPVDDARVEEIRKIVFGPNYYKDGRFYERDDGREFLGDALLLLQELCALLPRLSSGERRCGECENCHHSGPLNPDGYCVVDISAYVDPEGPFHGQKECFCKCVFPATGAGEGEQRGRER